MNKKRIKQKQKCDSVNFEGKEDSVKEIRKQTEKIFGKGNPLCLSKNARKQK